MNGVTIKPKSVGKSQILSSRRRLANLKFYQADLRQEKFNEMNGAHLASPIRGRAWLCSLAPAGNSICCPIGHQIWGPLGKQDVCPNFALTVRGHPFMTSTKNHVFDPLPLCPPASTWAGPPLPLVDVHTRST